MLSWMLEKTQTYLYVSYLLTYQMTSNIDPDKTVEYTKFKKKKKKKKKKNRGKILTLS